MPFFEAKNLTVRYGDAVILDKLSFSIDDGDIVAIIGPNGSGKTTLVKAILGLIKYDGEIKWARDVSFGYVPQKLEFDRSFPITVRELFFLRLPNVFFGSGKKRTTEKVRFLLSRVGAEKLLEKQIGSLSGGELQRVLVAYALVGRPQVLFFDEPSAGIDIGGEETIYNLIHQVCHEERLTAFFVSHDLDVVFDHADKVVCLNRKLICQGIPQKVLTGRKLEEIYGHGVATYEHHHE
ncbi:MAG: metal ABC transporter ATP-binding protein [Patescibacteria group bacterium]|nr:metal ABC transporter ATP-binding protein [Patescibacteria group bacterium]MDD5490411.1 metal ABC transporter ATP-binding protein [Patescibacteria group bacterium]